MLELISIVASLLVCILTPIEVAKIRNGWVRKKFAGDRTQFVAAYRKQLRMMIWLGLVFGVLGIGLAAIETTPGEPTVKIVASLIWFAVSFISFIGLRQLANVHGAGAVGNSGA